MITETKETIKNDLAQFVQKIGSQNAASKRMNGVSNATISNILAGKWDNIAESMWVSIQKQVTPSLDGWVVVSNISRINLLHKLYSDAKTYSEAYCIVAPAGSGKSEPSKIFANQPNVFRVVCKEHLNRKTFLTELLKTMGKETSGFTVYELMAEVIDTILKIGRAHV